MVPHKQKDTTGVENIGQTSEQLPSPGAAVNTKSFWSTVSTSSVACKVTRPKTWALKKIDPQNVSPKKSTRSKRNLVDYGR